MVRAQSEVRTAAARRRNAWAAYLPSLIRRLLGQRVLLRRGLPRRPRDRTAHQRQHRQPQRQHLALGQPGPVHRVSPRRGDPRGPGRPAGRRRLAGGRPLPAGARHHQPVLRRARRPRSCVHVREASVRRAEEQLKVSVAKLRAGSATRSDSLRSLVTLGNARLQLVNAQAALATAEAELGPAHRRDRPGRRGGRLRLLPGAAQRRHRRAPRRSRVALAPDPERRGQRASAARANVQASRSSLLAHAHALGQHRAGTAAGRTTTTCSTSGR